MKIILDDIGLDISEFDKGRIGKSIYRGSFSHGHFEFDDIIREVLTPAQYDRYIGEPTNRVFALSKKKAELLKSLIK